jgi:hypothetical protein
VAEQLVMSMGATGTVGVSATERFFCQPPKLETLSAIGAGDSMVAAIALELSRGGSLKRRRPPRRRRRRISRSDPGHRTVLEEDGRRDPGAGGNAEDLRAKPRS